MMCACGCGKPAQDLHHVCLKQHVRRAGGNVNAEANYIPLARSCHFAHHSGQARLRMSVVPDAAVDFARNLIGSGPASNYFLRSYRDASHDSRVLNLLCWWEREALQAGTPIPEEGLIP